MSRKSPLDQILHRCKHFTGIQHDECKAGVAYSTFRKPSGALFPLPCFSDEISPDQCEKAEWYSKEEAEAIEAEHQHSIREFLASITEGKCLICKTQVTQRQVGHCVYGSCGHRLYQGKVNPKFKEAQP